MRITLPKNESSVVLPVAGLPLKNRVGLDDFFPLMHMQKQESIGVRLLPPKHFVQKMPVQETKPLPLLPFPVEEAIEEQLPPISFEISRQDMPAQTTEELFLPPFPVYAIEDLPPPMSFERQDMSVQTTEGVASLFLGQGSEPLPKFVFSASVLKEGIGALKPVVSTKNLSIEDLEIKLAHTKNLLLREQIQQQIDEIKETKIKVGAFYFNEALLNNVEQESADSESGSQWDEESEEENEPFARMTENTNMHTNKSSKDATNEMSSLSLSSMWSSFTTTVGGLFNFPPKINDDSSVEIEMVRMDKRRVDVGGDENGKPVATKRINNTLGQNEDTDLSSTLIGALAKRRRDMNSGDDGLSEEWDNWDNDVVTTNNNGSYGNYNHNNDDIMHPTE